MQQIVRSALDQSGRDHQLVGGATNEHFNAALRREEIFQSPGKSFPCFALSDDDLSRTEIAYRAAAKELA